MTGKGGAGSVKLSSRPEHITARYARGEWTLQQLWVIRSLIYAVRCIPKMDHHCPWTINCVSHRTYPHFLRFIFYAVTSMTYLAYFLYIRAADIWEGRNLPSVRARLYQIKAHAYVRPFSILVQLPPK